MLSFAGIPLLLHDPAGAANDHLRKYLDERVASIFTPSLTCYTESRKDARLNNNQTSIQQVGLPVPNYPPQPRPKINTVFWPTGATRFAQGLFLIDGANLQAIINQMGGSGGLNENDPQPFVMTTLENSTGIATPMYLLPARPISPSNVPSDRRLWILPLVDVRYFWAQMPVPVFSPQSWNAAFAELASSLEATIWVDSIPAAYGVPDPTEWTRSYENSAMLLDAAAATIGMRFVADWATGSFQYRIVSATTAASDYAMNASTQIPPIAGDDFSLYSVASQTPGQVLTVYRNVSASDVSSLSSLVEASGPSDPNQTKTFFTTLYETRVLSTFANDLSEQLAEDYYAWLAARYDIEYTGILGWHPSGFDDFILWEYGVKKGRKKQYVSQTRVQSYPYNFGTCNVPVQPQPKTSSSSGSSSGSSGSSGSSSSSGSCGCVTVVTGVFCTGNGLTVQYGNAAGCCQ